MNTEKGIKKLTAKKFDLEDRLVDFSIKILELVELLPANRSGIISQDN